MRQWLKEAFSVCIVGGLMNLIGKGVIEHCFHHRYEILTMNLLLDWFTIGVVGFTLVLSVLWRN